MIICADDYGLAADIDAAIVELANTRRLSAVSCMTLFERCGKSTLAPLLALGNAIDIGLHLCLTNEELTPSRTPINPMPSFGTLLRRALSRRLEQTEMECAIREQYNAFFTKTGRHPDFIDGHLYVHQLPGIRQALIRFLQTLQCSPPPYVRNTALPIQELRVRGLPWKKATFIGLFGRRMAKLLATHRIPSNRGFAGIYDFRDCGRYPEYLPRFIDCLRHTNGLLVVHPGTAADWRRQETQALLNFHFPSGCPNRFNSGAG